MKIFVVLGLILLACASSIDARRVVCYWGTWATYRPGYGEFSVEHINPNICTHIIYSFFGVSHNGEITFLDEHLDLEENWGRGYIAKFIALKQINPNVKLMAAIGGYSFGSETFSIMAADAGARNNFAHNALAFMRRFGFDGLDMDWEYPAQRGGQPFDVQNFVHLLAETRAQLAPNGYLLTAAVAATENSARISYDIPAVVAQLDFVNLMTYDMHGPWNSFTGIHAPMYAGSGAITEFDRQLSVEAAVRFWLSQGTPNDKLVVGMPTYGKSFTLANPANNGILAPANAPGDSGPYTREAGTLGYNEICMNNWNTVFEPTQQVPYAFSGNQWVGYDNLQSINYKCNFIIQNNLGGGMIWSIETDDFRGNCGQGPYPLINTIWNRLH